MFYINLLCPSTFTFLFPSKPVCPSSLSKSATGHFVEYLTHSWLKLPSFKKGKVMHLVINTVLNLNLWFLVIVSANIFQGLPVIAVGVGLSTFDKASVRTL